MNESLKGIWHDDPNLESKFNKFLDADLYTNPDYALNKTLARSIQKVRMNSRGEPIKRACAGTKEQYQWVLDKNNPNFVRKKTRYDTTTDHKKSNLTSKFTS